jgi:hypothetical protein
VLGVWEDKNSRAGQGGSVLPIGGPQADLRRRPPPRRRPAAPSKWQGEPRRGLDPLVKPGFVRVFAAMLQPVLQLDSQL